MKRFILSIGLLCITATLTHAGDLNFGAGEKIQSYLLAVSSSAVPVVIDFNNDNKKDLIIGDGNGNVWFYQNFSTSDAAPVFSVGYELKVDNIPIDVISKAAPFITDWNNDGVLDLLVGDSNGKISLFTGSYFGNPPIPPDLDERGTILTISANNAAPFVCDWNNDNKKDLIIGDNQGNIWVYLNSGEDESPAFTNGGNKVLGTGSTPLWVKNDARPVVIDWDNNGTKDLIVGNGDGEIYLFLSSTPGTPTFTTGTKLKTADNNEIDVGNNATPFIVNWDNDGDMDLVVGEQDGSLNLFINTINVSNQTPQLSPPSKIAGVSQDLNAGQRITPFIENWNNDGKKDLIVGDKYGYVKLYLNSGEDNAPKFTDGYTFQVNAGTQAGIIDLDVGSNASPYVYDWNNDNVKDLIVGDTNGYINIFINSGNDTSPIFKPGTKTTTGTGTKPWLYVKKYATPIICDWNNDGKNDLVVGNGFGNVALYLNSGTNLNPVFPSDPTYIKTDNDEICVGANAKPYVVDFNGDYKKDLIIGNDQGYLKVYLNSGTDGNPIFTTDQSHCFQVESADNPLKVSGYAAPVVMDWNNDNILDLLVGEKDGYINLYTGSIENSAPTVLCDIPVGTQSSEITINYSLKDEENNVCSIIVMYSTNGGVNWITATAVAGAGDGVSNLNSSKEGVSHSFVWDSKGDLGGSFVGQVIIKVIPHDGMVEGISDDTGEFGVDNKNSPAWERIKLKGADLNLDFYSTPVVANWDEDNRRDILIGSKNGDVYFCKNVGTDQSPIFDVAQRLQAKTNTTWNVIDVGENSSPFVSNWDREGDKDLIVGDSLGYVWWFKNDSNQTPQLVQGEKIKVGADDIRVPGGNAVPVVVNWNRDGYDDLIVGDGNGHVYLYLNDRTSPTVPKLLSGVKIQANSDLDVGNNAAPYSIDWDRDYKDDLLIGNSDGYVFWYKNIGTNGTPTFTTGTKIKFAGNEIKVDANSRPAVLKQEGDNIDLLVGSKAGYVFLYRLTAVAQNTPPQLTITNPKGTQTTQTGSVSITYILQDDQWNTCKFTVEYSENGQNWYSASGTPKTDLESSPTGKEHTFIWFSDKDVPATLTYVYLRFIPNDGVDGQTATVSFYLRNKNNLPMVKNVLPAIGKLGYVEISYDLQDTDNDLCQVFVEYQGGTVVGKWATATLIGTVTNIAPGTGLKLTWLSSVDEKNQSASNYKIRITPFDIEYGTPGISTSFKVDNSLISSAIAPKGTTTTLIFSPTTIEILEPFSNDFDVRITVEKSPVGIPPMNTLASLNDTVRRITTTWLPEETKQPAPQTKAKITIGYTDLASYETEILLRIFELRENKWILVEGNQSVDINSNSVTAEVEHFSVFRIGLHATTFKIYPNPFKDNDGDDSNGELGVTWRDYIVFEGVTKVEIYTIAGELVRASKEGEIDYSDSDCWSWKWYLTNDYGRLVGSGIYIYVVKDSTGASLVGKVGVIR
ncbi:MAG: VCBS repeat-containing protein [Nitrospirota bacterium]